MRLRRVHCVYKMLASTSSFVQYYLKVMGHTQTQVQQLNKDTDIDGSCL